MENYTASAKLISGPEVMKFREGYVLEGREFESRGFYMYSTIGVFCA